MIRAARDSGGFLTRLFVVAVLVFSIPAAADERSSSESIIHFDISQQRADRALIEFAKQADRTLVYSFDVTRRIITNRVVGQFTIIEGLGQLIDGTGLKISLGSQGQLSIVEALAAESSVDAAAEMDVGGEMSNAIDGGALDLNDVDVREVLDEIRVSARKREERLQDIPTSAAVLTHANLQQFGVISELRDLTDLVAGITINDTQLGFISEPSIRGAGSGRNRMSASATGLYRNGAYVAGAGPGGKNFARMDYFDLQRAEILRGPQGALYGRNALGGAINLLSRKPQRSFGADIALRAGEKDMRNVEAVINVPVTEIFAIRASHINEERADGFYTDQSGLPVDTVDYQHSRLSLRLNPSDAIELTYVYDDQSQEFTPTFRLTDAAIAATGNEFETLINDEHHDTWEIANHNLNIDWKVGTGTLSFVSNYRDKFVEATQDSDYYLTPDRYLQRRRFSQLSDADNSFHEIRYVADGSERFRWLVGADSYRFDNHDVTDLTRGCPVPAVPDLIDEDYYCASSLWIRDNIFGMQNWSVFASAEYTFESVPVNLSVEARYAYDELDGHLVQYRPNREPFPELIRDFVVQENWTNIPWGVTADYGFEQLDALSYIKVASSYRHGGMNDGPGSEFAKYEAQLEYDEETNVSYELGWKQTLLNGGMTINVAAYYGLNDEFIAGTNDGCPDECTLLDENGEPLGFNDDGSRIGEDENGQPIPPNTAIAQTAFMDNVGDVELWGMEVELAYRKHFSASGRSIDFNLGWSRQMGSVTKLNEDLAEALRDKVLGARLQNMRPEQWKSRFVFRQPLNALNSISGFSGATLFASATYVYEEGGVWSLDIDNPNPMDTARRLNARLGLQTDRWSLILNGRNLTDESYHTWRNGNNDQYRRVDPRYIFAEFRWTLR